MQALLARGLQARAAGAPGEAEEYFREAARLDPLGVLPPFYLGNCAWERRDFDEAVRHYQQAIERAPQDLALRLNLCKAHVSRGSVDEALAELRTLAALDPDSYPIQSSFLFTQHYSERVAPDEIARTHREWGARFAARLAPEVVPAAPLREPVANRRLRVGYVSGDFRSHSVAYFIEAILEGHHRDRFEVFCYSTFDFEDAVTRRLRDLSDHWRAIESLSDAQAASAIRHDGIDILVDLSGHTWGGRPGLFARRAAPVQIIYLGYPDTSGLAEMDYRIVDHETDPAELAPDLHSERLLYLPATQWCFRPDTRLPEPGPLPMLARGYLEFGSLNDFSKVSDTALHCWGRILQAMPTARLRLLRSPEGERRARACALLGEYGIAPERITATGWTDQIVPGQQYREIDIALDSFPFNGVTTTCESLWMGLPVVNLQGLHSIARSGSSLLKCLGLDELVSTTADQYVEVALSLAADPARLIEYREGLRARMRRSALMDEPAFVGALEALYQSAWRECLLSRTGAH